MLYLVGYYYNGAYGEGTTGPYRLIKAKNKREAEKEYTLNTCLYGKVVCSIFNKKCLFRNMRTSREACNVILRMITRPTINLDPNFVIERICVDAEIDCGTNKDGQQFVEDCSYWPSTIDEAINIAQDLMFNPKLRISFISITGTLDGEPKHYLHTIKW